MPENPKIHILRDRYRDTVTLVAPYPRPTERQTVLRGHEDLYALSNARLAVGPDAASDLLDGVGRETRPDPAYRERIGALIGKYHTDMSGPIPFLWGNVTRVIPFDPSPGIMFSTDSRLAESLLRQLRDGEQILGWYRTRYGGYHLGLTQGDLRWHKHFFEGAVGFAAIFYPDKQIWSAYQGPEGLSCRGDIFIHAEETSRSRDKTAAPRITIHRDGEDPLPVRETPSPRLSLETTVSIETDDRRLEYKRGGWRSQVGQWLMRTGQQLSGEEGSPSLSSKLGGRLTVRDGAFQEVEERRSRSTVSSCPPVRSQVTVREKPRPPELRSEIWMLPDGDLSRREPVDPEDLETIAPNLSETVEAVLAKGLSVEEGDRAPLHAHVARNADLTLEVFLREGPDNALVCVASCTEEGLPAPALVRHHVELIKRDRLARADDATYYLIYICDPQDRRRRKVVVLQINIKGEDHEQ